MSSKYSHDDIVESLVRLLQCTETIADAAKERNSRDLTTQKAIKDIHAMFSEYFGRLQGYGEIPQKRKKEFEHLMMSVVEKITTAFQ